MAEIVPVSNTSAPMRRADLLCGGTLVALGVVSLVEALRIRDDWQGAKLMPAALAVALAVLGAGHAVPALAAAERLAWPDAAGWRRVVFVFGLLALYVAGLPFLGFLPATALFVLILVRALGAFSWVLAIALTGAIAVASHLVFQRWLGMPLP